MKINPLWILALVGGGLLYMNSRKKPDAVAGGATGQLPPAGGVGGGGEPNMSADGFVLTNDCLHMIVDNPQKAAQTFNAFYRTNVLVGGPLFIGMPGSADAHTRAFFKHYWKAMASNCLPKEAPGLSPAINPAGTIAGPYGNAYVLPTAAPLAQQILYSAIFSTMASYLKSDGRWTQEVAVEQVGRVIDMLKAAGVTQADWTSVFQGTVPMPSALILGGLS